MKICSTASCLLLLGMAAGSSAAESGNFRGLLNLDGLMNSVDFGGAQPGQASMDQQSHSEAESEAVHSSGANGQAQGFMDTAAHVESGPQGNTISQSLVGEARAESNGPLAQQGGFLHLGPPSEVNVAVGVNQNAGSTIAVQGPTRTDSTPDIVYQSGYQNNAIADIRATEGSGATQTSSGTLERVQGQSTGVQYLPLLGGIVGIQGGPKGSSFNIVNGQKAASRSTAQGVPSGYVDVPLLYYFVKGRLYVAKPIATGSNSQTSVGSTFTNADSF